MVPTAKPRTKQACLNCRIHHQKCDWGFPSCHRCRTLAVDCNRTVRWRHVRFSGHQEYRVKNEPDTLYSHTVEAASTSSNKKNARVNIFVNETRTFTQSQRDENTVEDDGDEDGTASQDVPEDVLSDQYCAPSDHSLNSEDIGEGNSSSALGSSDTLPSGNVDFQTVGWLTPSSSDRSVLTSNGQHPFMGSPQQLDKFSPLSHYLFNNPPPIVGLPLAANVQHLNPSACESSVSHIPPSPHLASMQLIDDLESYDNDGIETSHFAGMSQIASPIDVEEESRLREMSITRSFSYGVPAISHSREAYLLKVFTQTWGPIFDCLDADMTFTKSIFHIALSSFQPLFWAILATSALQLSRVSDYPLSAARYYRSQCSKSIMPILLQHTHSEAGEETLFATYVMLRNYEHMTENLLERDTETLFTASLAISARPSNTPSDTTDLGCASFWVHLRQDIHIALLLQVPINTDYPPCLHREMILDNLEFIISGASMARPDVLACAWANRMAVILVDVINYSFQVEDRGSQSWVELNGKLDLWNMLKPKTFQPYYERAPNSSEGRRFPDIWLSSDCSVLAWLYYHTAKVLLKSYPPNAAHFARNATRAPRVTGFESQAEILIHARAICGIVMTNPNAQALIASCHMVTVAAIFFTEEAEQMETLKLIRLAHSVTGHPLEAAEQRLLKAWSANGGEVNNT